MSHDLPPHILAARDQRLAATVERLEALAVAARMHTDTGCKARGCAGPAAGRAVIEMCGTQRAELLYAATAELARLGYGKPKEASSG